MIKVIKNLVLSLSSLAFIQAAFADDIRVYCKTIKPSTGEINHHRLEGRDSKKTSLYYDAQIIDNKYVLSQEQAQSIFNECLRIIEVQYPDEKLLSFLGNAKKHQRYLAANFIGYYPLYVQSQGLNQEQILINSVDFTIAKIIENPNIQEFLQKYIEENKKTFDAMARSHDVEEKALAVAKFSAIAASMYFSGPLVSSATRALFPYFYASIFGSVPTGFAYYLTYMPNLERACYYSYAYSNYILGGAWTTLYASYKGLTYGGSLLYGAGEGIYKYYYPTATPEKAALKERQYEEVEKKVMEEIRESTLKS